METHRLVLPEDLNQYGFLFGGRLLSWVDEASFIAASKEFPGRKFVTVGMDQVVFRHSVRNGEIIAIRTTKVTQGVTSATYQVSVLRGESEEEIFSTKVTFVSVGEDGAKTPI